MEELFKGDDLISYLQKRKKEASDAVHYFNDDDISGLTPEQLLDKIREGYKIRPLIIDFENIQKAESGRKKINVTGDHRFTLFPGMNPYVDGHYLAIRIPYSGDRRLFFYQPRIFYRVPLEASVGGDNLVLTIADALELTEETIKQQLNHIKSALGSCSASMNNDVNEFNNWIETDCFKLIKQRFEKASKLDSIIEKIGIGIYKREVEPPVISKPIQRKELPIKVTRQTTQNNDVILDLATYEEILETCSNMAKVMELSPAAFGSLKEEDLRFHFLVQLNGKYKGQATGETFNVCGKTDILVRIDGKNIFIAECKFWKGEKHYAEAIDQLFGYISWRDTKTAIIVFNTSVEPSEVLEKIDKKTKSHPGFISEDAAKRSESSFRYKFRHPEDSKKEFLVTVMLFNVPKNRKSKKEPEKVS